MPVEIKIGSRYGTWTVTSFSHSRKSKPYFECRCDCGAIRLVDGYNLHYGSSTNCGCLKSARWHQIITRHGDCRSPEYAAWLHMRSRCENRNNKKYPDYGGRGISVCKRWLNSYDNFLADMGRKPTPKHSLDRKDVDGDYSPANCRWATHYEQMMNKRRHKSARFKGIWFSTGSRTWQAQISKDGHRRHLGSFASPEQAAAAYAKAAEEMYG